MKDAQSNSSQSNDSFLCSFFLFLASFFCSHMNHPRRRKRSRMESAESIKTLISSLLCCIYVLLLLEEEKGATSSLTFSSISGFTRCKKTFPFPKLSHPHRREHDMECQVELLIFHDPSRRRFPLVFLCSSILKKLKPLINFYPLSDFVVER
jgi:hypothetical protein